MWDHCRLSKGLALQAELRQEVEATNCIAWSIFIRCMLKGSLRDSKLQRIMGSPIAVGTSLFLMYRK